MGSIALARIGAAGPGSTQNAIALNFRFCESTSRLDPHPLHRWAWSPSLIWRLGLRLAPTAAQAYAQSQQAAVIAVTSRVKVRDQWQPTSLGTCTRSACASMPAACQPASFADRPWLRKVPAPPATG